MEETFDPGDDSMILRGAQEVVRINNSIKVSDSITGGSGGLNKAKMRLHPRLVGSRVRKGK